jgi:hypothetical protein
MPKDDSLETLLFQYRECWGDIRQYDNLIWQIPSVTTIIVGVLIALSPNIMLTIQIALFIVALSLNFVMTIALHKHQFFRIHRFREIERIQNALRDRGMPLLANGAKSTETIKQEIKRGILLDMPQGWFYNRTAYTWIRCYMYLLNVVLALGLTAIILQGFFL